MGWLSVAVLMEYRPGFDVDAGFVENLFQLVVVIDAKVLLQLSENALCAFARLDGDELSKHFEHIDVVCSEFSAPGITWADYVRAHKSKRSLYYLPEWHSKLLLQWLHKGEVASVHPGQEIPQKKYDIIVTDEAHHRQMQELYPSAEIHDWDILPSGSRLVPDYRRIAMFAVERLLQLMKGRNSVVEKIFISFCDKH